MACFHPNGISYSIIKQKLPIINSEIQKILSNIVNFEVFFESEEKKLNILIKHPKYSPRPLESGSGAEKSIAAMAIRLALLSVSSLPKSDIFILDEPGTSLDANNLEGFTRIVDLIKTNFKTVLLISHMDFLKDIVDSTIDIDKVDGFARVNQ
jgi:DNA repair exonuclease SbcCD ATPase subunit